MSKQKLEWIERSMEPIMAVSLAHQKAGVEASQLIQWRKAYTEGLLVAVGAIETIVLASELQD